METTDGPTPGWREIEQWLREGQYIVGRLIPSLLQECETLRTRAKVAEEHSQRLSAEFAEVKGEVLKLQGEIDHVKLMRAKMVEAIETCITEIGRLTSEARVKIKEASS